MQRFLDLHYNLPVAQNAAICEQVELARLAEDLINRVVEGGIAPMDALVSANSLAAEAMKMSEHIARSRPGSRLTSLRLMVIP